MLSGAAAVAWRVVAIAAAVVAVGVALVAVGLAFTKLRLIILPIVVAVFFSTVLVPPASWLRRHGWPPLLATWAVLLFAVVVVAGVVAALEPTTASEVHTVGNDVNRAIDKAENWLSTGPLHLSRAAVRSDVTKLRHQLSTHQSTLIKGALSGVTLLAQAVGAALLAAVVTFFFVKDGDRITSWWLDLFSPQRAEDLRQVGRRCWEVLTGYIRGSAVNGLINATALAIALLALGVPLVVPIAVLTFVASFLPLVGGILSGAVAAAVTLATKGWVAALIVVGVTLLIHNLEGYIVGPKVLGHAVRLHPLAVILVLALGTTLGGVIGAFLAVPTVAILLAVNEHYRQKRRASVATRPSLRSHPQQPGPTRPADRSE